MIAVVKNESQLVTVNVSTDPNSLIMIQVTLFERSSCVISVHCATRVRQHAVEGPGPPAEPGR
eukprot:2394130-Rhodomonas_salina.3